MAAIETTIIPLGFKAPDFILFDAVSEKKTSLSDMRGKNGFVIMFICNHCPYVKHVNKELVKLAKDYTPLGFSFIAISSNDINKYPEDAPEKMKETAMSEGYIFPYLYDETQEVARAYMAVCTPDFSIFDSDAHCVYRGRLDDSRPGNNKEVTGIDIRNALDNLLSGKEVNKAQFPSIGCSIKWKS